MYSEMLFNVLCRRPCFTPVRAAVTISFKKLLKSKNVQLGTFIVKDYVTCEFTL